MRARVVHRPHVELAAGLARRRARAAAVDERASGPSPRRSRRRAAARAARAGSAPAATCTAPSSAGMRVTGCASGLRAQLRHRPARGAASGSSARSDRAALDLHRRDQRAADQAAARAARRPPAARSRRSLRSTSSSTPGVRVRRKWSRPSSSVSGVRRRAAPRSRARARAGRCRRRRSGSTSNSTMSTPAASAASKLASVLPGAMWSAPLWPIAGPSLQRWHPGTSSRAVVVPLAAAADRARRSAGTACRRAVDRRASASGCRPCADCCIRGRVGSTIAQRLVVADLAGRPPRDRRPRRSSPRPSTGCRCPAIVRWSSSASPIGRVGSSSRRRRRNARSARRTRAPRMSGPSAASRAVEARARLGQQLEHRPVELHDLVACARAARARRGAASAASAGPPR